MSMGDNVVAAAQRVLKLGRGFRGRPSHSSECRYTENGNDARNLHARLIRKGYKAKKRGVDSVNTISVGLGRTGAGLARTRHVFGSSQCFQGSECGSSPTSGTAFPLVRGVFALTCVQSLWWRPSDARCAGWCLAAAVAYEGVWVAGSGSWLVGPPPALGWGYAVPRSGSVWLVVVGQHQFMAQGSGDDMMKPTLARKRLGKLLSVVKGELCMVVCPAKVGVDSVHTYVCFMEAQMAVQP